MSKANDFQLTPNFNLREFQCRHCGQVKICPKLVNLLQILREKLDRPITITSGYRCPEHNKNVGGAPNSYHAKGMAADILVAPTGLPAMALGRLCEEIGFTGLGLYPEQGFIHVDVRPGSFVRFK